MRRFTFFLVAVATMAGLVALIGPARGHADGQSAPYVTDIPRGYPRLAAGFPRPMKKAT